MLIAGVDEAGRGPLAGPVTAAAVILKAPIDGLTDSKKLTERKRDALAVLIKQQALAWSVVHIDVQTIDSINILQATLLGMQQAVEQLSTQPDAVKIDGNKAPQLNMPVETIVKGDLLEPAISAASILAKTARDQIMYELHQSFPNYGFAQHKGYGTQLHLQSLQMHGPCHQHRRSFAPVARLLNG